jgi:nitroimidazol reductase NimA-like FMN-containing flavoprotein (pyridoxamine 5'-phosphate oxidase superfamily)
MSSTVSASISAHFGELAAEECLRLLEQQSSGRVAWNAPDGPQILPVSYAMYAGEIVFRTSAYGVLAQLARPTNVAFEIDEISHPEGTSWSVLVRGRAQAVVTSRELVTLWTSSGITPRAPGVRNVWIAITAHSITGRTVKPPTWNTSSPSTEPSRSS